jgi:protease-4
MGKLDKIKEAYSEHRRSLSYIFIILIIVSGYFIAGKIIEQPKVGIIRIDTSIMSMDTASKIAEMMRYARDRDDIKAVVLEINSPGGEVTATEEVYLNVLELRKVKPVVASIDQIGASGAYYIASASNLIYSKPASFVGSIGVISRLPKPEKLDEETISTGPFKRTGFSRRDHIYNIKLAQETFLHAVMLQRGSKLNITKEELAKGAIYMGLEAYRLGLVDNIGSTSDAIAKAAELAGIARYGIVDINEELGINFFLFFSTYVNESYFAITNTVPVNYYLYMEFEE